MRSSASTRRSHQKQGGSEHVSFELVEPAASESVRTGLGTSAQNDERLIEASVRVNFFLLCGKATAFSLSSSPVILTSFVDSAADVVVQAALHGASRLARRSSALYPVGRGQLEPVAVVVCAALKCAGMIAVFVDSADDLYDGDTERRTAKHGWLHIWKHHRESVLLFALVSLVKLAFCTWCELVVRGGRGVTTETARAVLVDNHNDLLLSVGALVATIITEMHLDFWWVDPAAACVLAAYIFFSWLRSGRQQVDLIVGRAAEPKFLELVREIAETHDPSTSLQLVRAYHYGPRFLVELELVMDEHTPLRESHDVGILLQHKIESLPAVERCFVNLDYAHREDVDKHDHNTPIARKIYVPREDSLDSSSGSLAGLAEGSALLTEKTLVDFDSRLLEATP